MPDASFPLGGDNPDPWGFYKWMIEEYPTWANQMRPHTTDFGHAGHVDQDNNRLNSADQEMLRFLDKKMGYNKNPTGADVSELQRMLLQLMGRQNTERYHDPAGLPGYDQGGQTPTSMGSPLERSLGLNLRNPMTPFGGTSTSLTPDLPDSTLQGFGKLPPVPTSMMNSRADNPQEMDEIFEIAKANMSPYAASLFDHHYWDYIATNPSTPSVKAKALEYAWDYVRGLPGPNEQGEPEPISNTEVVNPALRQALGLDPIPTLTPRMRIPYSELARLGRTFLEGDVQSESEPTIDSEAAWSFDPSRGFYQP